MITERNWVLKVFCKHTQFDNVIACVFIILNSKMHVFTENVKQFLLHTRLLLCNEVPYSMGEGALISKYPSYCVSDNCNAFNLKKVLFQNTVLNVKYDGIV